MSISIKPKLLIILGPTSGGKTDVAIELAKKLNGELVAADSRQVYKSLDIGTGKMPSNQFQTENQISKGEGYWIISDIKIWLYDVVSPDKQYSIWEYVQAAGKIIDKISREKKLPVVVGGTGLYIKGLTDGFDNLSLPIDLDLRQSLENLDLKSLQKKLFDLSPIFFATLNNSEKNNKRRLIRKIEILSQESKKSPTPKINRNFKGIGEKYDIFKIGLSAPRPVLNKRIDLRVDARIKQGMVAEAEKLYQKGLSIKRMESLGLEYKVLAGLLTGKIKSIDEFAEVLKNKIHQYAKRQITWFKKDKNIVWFDTTTPNFEHNLEKAVTDWYND